MWADPDFITWKETAGNGNADFTLAELVDGTNGFAGISAYYGLCDNGYICLEGSTSNQPSIASEGYECPEGYYCANGAIVEVPCPPGYYNPST